MSEPSDAPGFELFSRLFAPIKGIAWCSANPERFSLANLGEPELSVVKDAVESRQREYAAGRFCARSAMQELGARDQHISSNPDRSPRWPESLVGSISHTRSLCVAVVANSQQHRGLGVDIEQRGALSSQLQERVLIAAEKADLEQSTQMPVAEAAKVVFCIKEAVYKCQYPISQKYFGFSALRVTIDWQRKAFAAEYREPAPPFALGSEISGLFDYDSQFLAAVASLPTL